MLARSPTRPIVQAPAVPPTPIAVGQPSTPQTARLARQDADIAQLVNSNNLLKAELERGRNAVKDLQARVEAERKEWKLGCDALQALHHTAHLRHRVALSNEALARQADKQKLQQMKIATSVRNHRLSRFQARELELNWQIQDLLDETEREREDAATQLEATVQEYQAREDDFDRRLAKAELQRQQKADALAVATKAKEVAETSLSHLRIQHSALEETQRSTSHKLERALLEISSLQAHEKDWKSRASDWQSLERKSEREQDNLKRVKTELEATIRELEQEHADKKKKETSESKALEKEKKRVASLNEKIDKLEGLLETAHAKVTEAQREAAEAHADTARAQEQVTRAQKQLSRLQSQAASTSSKPPSKTVVDDSPPASPPPKPTRQPRKAAPTAPLVESDDEAQSASSPPPAPKPKAARKPPAPKPAAGHKRTASKLQEAESDEDDGDEVVAVEPPAKAARSRAGTVPAAAAAEEQDVTEDGQKKKKRKLIATGPPQPFQWAAVDTGGGIPNMLSPLKGGAPAPARAGVGRSFTLTSGRIF